MTAPLPSAEKLLEVCEVTWPPAKAETRGAWTFRDGAGGGKRVSAATENWPTTEVDLKTAEVTLRVRGQPLLFQVREGEEALDHLLEAHGYNVIDPVNIWAVHVADLLHEEPPKVSGFAIWPPLNIMTELWEAGGITAGRRAVMDRAPMPKSGLLARSDDSPAGAGFIGIHDGIAMIHAIHVDPNLRRKGSARNMLLHAARWAHDNGANVLSLIVTQGNHAANPLYANLGMQLVGHYHYRIKGEV
ncbi:GNAT family N-acetyltransferase [Aliiroseovarius subalbicans]|uniref:GNAT family N-acetyltransferase n=1 Tax=Aliiroseovarius subalbicans TaxID=2925840 RepID=UPI001F56E4F6|nr:GNAT family N-acetyltransferase [Aliiroseovarius subalbicans]MCI2399490.1 GNAT family N-acetyltransferase [Aliiroseovarius subalbicans]